MRVVRNVLLTGLRTIDNKLQHSNRQVDLYSIDNCFLV